MPTKRALIAALMLGAAFAAAAHEPTKPAPDPNHAKPMQGMSQDKGSMELQQAMMGGDMGAAKMTGDTDRDFAAMMIMHHESGVRMMDVELKHGKNPALKAMAKKMRDQQATEIEQLKNYR